MSKINNFEKKNNCNFYLGFFVIALLCLTVCIFSNIVLKQEEKVVMIDMNAVSSKIKYVLNNYEKEELTKDLLKEHFEITEMYAYLETVSKSNSLNLMEKYLEDRIILANNNPNINYFVNDVPATLDEYINATEEILKHIKISKRLTQEVAMLNKRIDDMKNELANDDTTEQTTGGKDE